MLNFGDENDYLSAARTLFVSDSHLRTGDLFFLRSPAYSSLIAILWLISKVGNMAILKTANLFLHVLSILILENISSEFMSEIWSLAAAVIFGLNPLFLDKLTGVQTESLVTFLLVRNVELSLNLIIDSQNNGERLRPFALLGAVISVITFVCSQYLLITLPIVLP